MTTNNTTQATETKLIAMGAEKKTEWVAVLHGQTGTVKIAYRNARALAVGLEGQTKEGWVVARVYQRVAETYSEV